MGTDGSGYNNLIVENGASRNKADTPALYMKGPKIFTFAVENIPNIIKETLENMISEGGRDTEKDLLGNPGGYHCILSKNTCHELCPRCGGKIIKEAYLGGSIYYCRDCQTI